MELAKGYPCCCHHPSCKERLGNQTVLRGYVTRENKNKKAIPVRGKNEVWATLKYLIFSVKITVFRPKTPAVALYHTIQAVAQNTFNSSIRPSQNQSEGSNNRLAKAGGRRPDALPAGLVGFSAGRRLQKLFLLPYCQLERRE